MALRSFFQTAWVVPDLETAIHGWVEHAGVGPFFLLPHLRITGGHYRGSATDVQISVALAQVGPMQIELIEQHDDQPSPFTELIDRSGATHHHVAAMTYDIDGDLDGYADLGVDVVFSGMLGDARFVYLDTRAKLGCMTELIERRPAGERLFALLAETGAVWDGLDPIRRLPRA